MHHSADPNDYGPDESAEVVREIQYDHMHRRGRDDIGYHFLVDRYGTVFEGRTGAMETRRAVAGSHAAGFNRETVGIAVIGTYSAVQVPEAALDAVARIAARAARYAADQASGSAPATDRRPATEGLPVADVHGGAADPCPPRRSTPA